MANLGMEMKFQFCDVFGLDPDLLMMVPQPCIALLLLFPINEKVAIPTNYHNFVKLKYPIIAFVYLSLMGQPLPLL